MTRVLLVDDEPHILRVLAVILRAAGYEVAEAATIHDALVLAVARPPDAAIVDLVLPDGSGVELTRRLRHCSAMPIVVLSAAGDEQAKADALYAGADDYVTKPFDPADLLARLAAAGRGPSDEPRLEANGLAIDLNARLVRQDAQELDLTPI